MSGRLKALLLLAWAFVRTLWRRAWGDGAFGLARFSQNYADDGLTSLQPEEREAMRQFGRCIACGRCNRGDAPRILESKGRFSGTMGLVLAATRSMPDFKASARGFAHLSEADLEAKERVCPTGVPFRRLAAFVRAHAADARVSVPAAQGAKRLPSSVPPRSSRARQPSRA